VSLLQTSGMSVTFGGLRAVNNVDLTVEKGKLVGLIGPNGAGKTTFIDGITGFVPTTGRIEFKGQEINSMPVHSRARLGLGRTWQSLELFDDLTIEENVQVAAERQSTKNFLLDLVRPNRNRDRSGVDFAFDVRPSSRLSCQIKVGPALDELKNGVTALGLRWAWTVEEGRGT